MARHTAVVSRDLEHKHARMAENPFVFLRGTFYRWAQQWRVMCGAAAEAPTVLAVGDLHVENFGTWRDVEGRLVWGVNDVDEACVLPYTQDLIRLATSAVLAVRQGHFALQAREACDAILDGYIASLERGGRPLVLAERRRWLRQIALSELRDPKQFWDGLQACRPATGAIPHRALRLLLPDPALKYRTVHRVAGVGSLGRKRFVALTTLGGSLIAREAKAALPPAAVWADGSSSSRVHGSKLLRRAVRVGDPFFAVTDDWIIRRLAPDCSRVELTDLPADRDELKLLRAMGGETANIHLGSSGPRIRRDLKHRPRRWLQIAAETMVEVVRKDWRAWRS
jgi:hypothetical protein